MTLPDSPRQMIGAINTREGCALAYSEMGDDSGAPDAPAVVALHGLASSGRTMRRALAPIAEQGMRVLLPDLLGYGASPQPSGVIYDAETHVNAVRDCADARLGATRPLWLVGSSMGALFALAWAAQEPERVRGVVAISAPLFTSPADARRSLARNDPIASMMLRTPWLAQKSCHVLCGTTGPGYRISRIRRARNFFGRGALWMFGLGGLRPVADADDRSLAQEGLLEAFEDVWLHSWESLNSSLRHGIVARQAWGDLERLRARGMPLLFLHGDRDALAPIVRARQAAGFGGWPLREYPRATHALTVSHTGSVGREIARFITEAEQEKTQVARMSTPRHVIE